MLSCFTIVTLPYLFSNRQTSHWSLPLPLSYLIFAAFALFSLPLLYIAFNLGFFSFFILVYYIFNPTTYYTTQSTKPAYILTPNHSFDSIKNYSFLYVIYIYSWYLLFDDYILE